MSKPPEGTVTFVFTDIVGSTRLWEKFPTEMAGAIRTHDEALKEIFARHHGYVFKTVGDAFCVAFETPADAVRACIEVQCRLASEDWGVVGKLTVRIGVHTGPAELRGNDYFGGTVNRTSRIESAAHAGQILVSGVTRELMQDDPAEFAAFKDLGEHRLRSLERPEHLFQVVADHLISDFPPPRSMEVLPNNLPVQTTSFIGRDREMGAVVDAMEGKVRMLTLVGTGGTGKTRLAMEAGARLISMFRDGVWLVELALLTDASKLLQGVTSALGLREEPGRPLMETLLAFLRKKKILIILDNCEQLTGSVASLCLELLRTCPELKILATSRHSLGIAGESILSVPPLGILDIHREEMGGPGFVAKVASYDAVKLFLERAGAVKPGFVINNDNAPAIAEICSRLDGIPLAIELAAARIRLLDAKQIAARLVDRFRLLRGGSADRLPHQQTLQALIDWSYDLLSEEEKILLRRLGVFVGGRGLEAIESVCSAPPLEADDVMDLLQQLVEKSLVSVEESDDTSPRYTMLESVWHYARNKLREAGEDHLLRDRHLEYFLARAEEASPEYEGPNQKMWLDLFNEDIFNFEAAMGWCMKNERDLDALRFLVALGRPLEVRGYLTEAREDSLTILARNQDAPPALLARATRVAARIAWAADDINEAAKQFARAAELAKEAGDPVNAGMCLAFVGFVERNEGRESVAEEFMQKAMDIAVETGSTRLRAICLSGFGRIALGRGDVAAARKMLEESLTIYRGLGDHWVIGLILWGVARAAIAGNDIDRAESALCEWMSIVLSLGNNWLVPYIVEAFGSAAIATGEYERAGFLFGGASALLERQGGKLTPEEQATQDEAIAAIRANLSPEAFQTQWKNGAETPTDQLITIARRNKCFREAALAA